MAFWSGKKVQRLQLDVVFAFANTYSVTEFESWAVENEFEPANEFYDEAQAGWRLPCSMQPIDWMLEKSDRVACFERAVGTGSRNMGEVLLVCMSRSEQRYDNLAIAHMDKGWPAGTWEGTLLPEDYSEQKWCVFQTAKQS